MDTREERTRASCSRRAVSKEFGRQTERNAAQQGAFHDKVVEYVRCVCTGEM